MKVRLGMVIVLLALAAFAFGVFNVRAGGETYTGCLSTKGKLSRVKAGPEPTSPCGGSQQITWTSGGPPGPTGPPGELGLESESCPPGSGLKGFDENGAIVCENF